MKDLDYEEIEVTCANCGIDARFVFSNMPEFLFKIARWYCTESCYEEHTRNEG